MTPTLEEVKEYFKNAKEVNFLDFGYKKQDITECLGNLYEGGLHDIYTEFESNGRKVLLYDATLKKYAKILSYKDDLETPKHYDNSNGTLYKVATERNWNPYLFDVVKRLERAEKKGEFKTDLEKSINVIKLWLKEYDTK
jgi:hypothetical protein